MYLGEGLLERTINGKRVIVGCRVFNPKTGRLEDRYKEEYK